MPAQLKAAPPKPRLKRQLLSQSGVTSRSQTIPATKKSTTKPPARVNRTKKPTEPRKIPIEEPTFEPRVFPFGDEFYDENGIDWHPELDEDLDLVLDNVKVECGSEKGDDDNVSISKAESKLNYNYIVTFNVPFEKTKVVAKGSKICARYKDDFEFDIQLTTWS